MANPANITLRSEKGTFLTFEEMDLNLTELQNLIYEYDSFLTTQFNPLDADHDDIRVEWANYQVTTNNRLHVNEQDITDINNDQTVQDGRITQNENDILDLQLSSGLTDKGNYDPNDAPYSIGDVVSYSDGLDYISLIDNNTQEPVSGTSTAEWLLLIVKARVVYSLQSSSFSASVGGWYSLDASTSFTITLPSTPSLGDIIKFVLVAGDATVNNLTIARNGQTIDGVAADMTIDSNSPREFSMYFNGTTWGTF